MARQNGLHLYLQNRENLPDLHSEGRAEAKRKRTERINKQKEILNSVLEKYNSSF